MCLAWVIRKIGKSRYMVMGHLCILVGVVGLPKRYKDTSIRLVYVCEGYRYLYYALVAGYRGIHVEYGI